MTIQVPHIGRYIPAPHMGRYIRKRKNPDGIIHFNMMERLKRERIMKRQKVKKMLMHNTINVPIEFVKPF